MDGRRVDARRIGGWVPIWIRGPFGSREGNGNSEERSRRLKAQLTCAEYHHWQICAVAFASQPISPPTTLSYTHTLARAIIMRFAISASFMFLALPISGTAAQICNPACPTPPGGECEPPILHTYIPLQHIFSMGNRTAGSMSPKTNGALRTVSFVMKRTTSVKLRLLHDLRIPSSQPRE
jgi:hypothetical protein